MIKLSLILLILAVMTSMRFAEASPLCSRVLQVNSHGSVVATIESIARLKLEIDTAKANGESNGAASKSLQRDFPKKYQELIENLSGVYSEKEVRELIQKKIAELQNQKEKTDSEEQIQKEKSTKEVNDPKNRFSDYYLDSSVPFNVPSFGSGSGHPTLVLPDGRLIYYQNDGMHTFDIVKKKDHTLRSLTDIQLFTVQGYDLVAVSNKKLIVYNIKKEKMISEFALPQFENKNLKWPSINFSPQKKFALIAPHGGTGLSLDISIVNLKTGAEVFNYKQIDNRIISAEILDEKYILMVLDRKVLVRMEMETGKIVDTFELPGANETMSFSSIVAFADLKLAALASRTTAFSFNPYDLSQVRAEPLTNNQSYDHIFGSAQRMPGSYPELLGFNPLSGPRIFDIESLKEVFNFEMRYGEPNHNSNWLAPYAVAVSPDKSKIYVVHVAADQKPKIDIWKLKPSTSM